MIVGLREMSSYKCNMDSKSPKDESAIHKAPADKEEIRSRLDR